VSRHPLCPLLCPLQVVTTDQPLADRQSETLVRLAIMSLYGITTLLPRVVRASASQPGSGFFFSAYASSAHLVGGDVQEGMSSPFCQEYEGFVPASSPAGSV